MDIRPVSVLLQNSQKGTWLASDLIRIRETCQCIEKIIFVCHETQDAYLGGDNDGLNINFYLFPSLLLFTRMAVTRGVHLESSLDKIGVLDTLEVLGQLLVKMMESLSTSTISPQLTQQLCQTSISVVMLIEAGLFVNKVSCVAFSLELLQKCVSLLHQRNQPFLTLNIPFSFLVGQSHASTSLMGFLIQCVSRLIYHVSGQKLFFEQLHEKRLPSSVGSKCVGNRNLFSASLQLLRALLCCLGNCSPEGTCCIFHLPTVSKKYYDQRSLTFLKSVVPGLLSEMVNLVVSKEAFKLRGTVYILQIVELLVVPFVTSDSKDANDLTFKVERLSRYVSNFKGFSLLKQSVEDLENSDFLKKLGDALFVIFENVLSFVLERVDVAKFSCRDQVMLSESDKQIAYLLNGLAYSLLNEADFIQLGCLFTVTHHDVQFKTVLIEVLVTTLYLLQGVASDASHRDRFAFQEKMFLSYDFVSSLTEDFFVSIRKLDPLKLAVRINAKTVIQTSLFKFLSYLNVLLPHTHRSIISLEAIYFSCLSFFYVDWRLSSSLMLDTVGSSFDIFYHWVDEIPHVETALLWFSKGSKQKRYSKSLHGLQEGIVAELVKYGFSMHTCKQQEHEFTIESLVDDSENITVEILLVDILAPCVLLINSSSTGYLEPFRDMVYLIHKWSSPCALLNGLMRCCDERVLSNSSLFYSGFAFHSIVTPSEVLSFPSIAYLLNRVGFLFFIIFVFHHSPVVTKQIDIDLLWNMVDLLTRDMRMGGFWVESSVLYDSLSQFKNPPSTDDYLSDEGVFTLTNLFHVALVTALTVILQTFSEILSKAFFSFTSDSACIMFGRLKSIAYSVLKSCGSVYRWRSVSSKLLFRVLTRLLSRWEVVGLQREDFLGQFKQITPLLLDSLCCELREKNRLSGFQHFNVEKNSSLGDALIAILLFAEKDTVLSLVDIIPELTNDFILPNSTSDLNSPTLPFNVSFAGFRARVALAKRLSSFIIQLKRIDFNNNNNSLYISNSQIPPDVEHLVREGSELLRVKVYQSSSLCNVQANIEQDEKNEFSLFADRYQQSLARSDDQVSYIRSDEASLIRAIEMARSLIYFSRRYLFHPNRKLQYLAHLTCFYGLHCHVVSQHSFLPQLHQLWDTLKSSLLENLVQFNEYKHPQSLVALTACSLRCCVIASDDFLSSRCLEELLPSVLAFLESCSPISEMQQCSQSDMLRTQICLLELLFTICRAYEVKYQMIERILNMCHSYLTDFVVSQLKCTALRLAVCCITADPERSLLWLITNISEESKYLRSILRDIVPESIIQSLKVMGFLKLQCAKNVRSHRSERLKCEELQYRTTQMRSDILTSLLLVVCKFLFVGFPATELSQLWIPLTFDTLLREKRQRPPALPNLCFEAMPADLSGV